MNDKLKKALAELGLVVNEVTIKYDVGNAFGLPTADDNFVIKGTISKEFRNDDET